MQDFQPGYTRGVGVPGARGLVIGLLGVFVTFLLYHLVSSRLAMGPRAEPRAIMARGELAEDERSTIELFRQASPSVVYITTSRLVRPGFSFNLAERPQGAGSGFVWDDQGHIVTNHHVIQGAHVAHVTFDDGTSTTAQLVGNAPERDLVVLRVNRVSDKLIPLPLGSSSDLQVGQKVFAIGNPFGFDQTLTTGVISGLEREIRTPENVAIRGVIQTDAAINPGNSGGPLLDSAGRLIGVNTAIVSPSGAYAGVGFAVPVDTVNRIVPQLVRYGKAARAGLGAMIVPPHIQRRLGIRGAIVVTVQEGGPADRAGIRPMTNDRVNTRLGDVILAVDGEAVRSKPDLDHRLGEHDAGDTVKLTILRDGGQIELSVELQAELDN